MVENLQHYILKCHFSIVFYNIICFIKCVLKKHVLTKSLRLYTAQYVCVPLAHLFEVYCFERCVRLLKYAVVV